MWALLPLLLAGSPEVVPPEPLVRRVQESDRAYFSMAHDDRGVMYFGQRGRIVAYDGHTLTPLELPATDRVLALRVEGDRLWYGGGGDFGFARLGARARVEFVSLRDRVEVEDPIVQAALPLEDAVHFGTSNGWLFRCPRPVTPDSDCTRHRVAEAGYTIFSAHGGRVWAQVQGRGLFRFDRGDFTRVQDDGPFVSDRMTIDLPGRRPGERLYGFYRAGLFWWTAEAGLVPFKGRDDGFRQVYRGRRLPDGRYVVITYGEGLRLVDATGRVETWRAPDVLDADLVFRIHVDAQGLLWVKTLLSLSVIAPNPGLRVYDVRSGGEEVRGLRTIDGQTYVLFPSRLYRLNPDLGPAPGRLETVAPLRSADALEVVDGRLVVATDDGLQAIEDDGTLRTVWPSRASITDLATHPAHPDRLFVGHVHGLSVLRRTGRVYEVAQKIPFSDEAIRLTFEDARTLWFAEGSRRLRMLRFDGETWTPGAPTLPQHPRLPTWHYLGRDGAGLWAVRGRFGLYRRDASGRFQRDGRVAERLGLPLLDTAIAQRPDSPGFALAMHPTEGGPTQLWMAALTPAQRLDEADWRPYPPWFLGPVGHDHIFEEATDTHFLLGGVGLVMAIAKDASRRPEAPAVPIVRRLEARSRTSTAVHPVADGARLAWDDRGLLAEYASPEHHPGTRLEYRTRVLELGGQWSPWDVTPRHVFDALPEGAATIEIQARDETGRASPTRRLALVVAPPFHRSPPVLLGASLLALALLGGGVAAATRRARRRAEQLAREVVERKKSEALARGQTALLGRTLENLTERPQLDTFLQAILSSLRRELSAEAVQLWVRDGDDALVQHTRLPADAVWRAPADGPLDEPKASPPDVWLPLRSGDEPLGRIGVFGARDLPLDEPRRYVAQALATQATLAIQLASLAGVERELAVQTERASLSREVHDNVAQGFVLTGLQMDRAFAGTPPERMAPELRRQLEAARELNREGLAEARRLIRLLRWEAPDELALPELLEGLRNRVELMGLTFSLKTRGDGPELGPREAFELYQIAHEAVTNSLKHAQARTVRLRLDRGPDEVRMEIVDDGVGFQGETSTGLGLEAMRTRARALGATLETVSTDGTHVEVRLPRKPD